jgi:hypothetical protein
MACSGADATKLQMMSEDYYTRLETCGAMAAAQVPACLSQNLMVSTTCGSCLAGYATCMMTACQAVCPMASPKLSLQCVQCLNAQCAGASPACVENCGGSVPPDLYCSVGGCVSATTDPNNCGGCGIVCSVPADGPSFDACCATVCTDLGTDVLNCGTCGHQCSGSQVCAAGGCGQAPGTSCTTDSECSTAHCTNAVCVCPSTLTLCGNACVDTNTDPNNCSGCNTPCPANMPICQNGTCGL